jgi:hypothetical protein
MLKDLESLREGNKEILEDSTLNKNFLSLAAVLLRSLLFAFFSFSSPFLFGS